jgi:hypothetical protein
MMKKKKTAGALLKMFQVGHLSQPEEEENKEKKIEAH